MPVDKGLKTTFTALRSEAPLGSENTSANVLERPDAGFGITETTVGGWLGAGVQVPLLTHPVVAELRLLSIASMKMLCTPV